MTDEPNRVPLKVVAKLISIPREEYNRLIAERDELREKLNGSDAQCLQHASTIDTLREAASELLRITNPFIQTFEDDFHRARKRMAAALNGGEGE